MTFRSRYSIILLVIALAPAVFMTYEFIKQPDFRIILVLIGYVGIVMMVSGFRYIIADHKLISMIWTIKIGEVEISSMTKIKRSYLVLSSNAGSLKRLYITLKGGSPNSFLLISPNNETEFLRALKEINPKIDINVPNKKGKFRFWDWDI